MSRPKKAQSQLLLARQIVAHVFENKFEKGHHLVETTLAKRFGVSRTLIRASLKHLAKEDMVEPRRNQGFFLLRRWDEINAGAISVPPSVADALYRRIVRDRTSSATNPPYSAAGAPLPDTSPTATTRVRGSGIRKS